MKKTLVRLSVLLAGWLAFDGAAWGDDIQFFAAHESKGAEVGWFFQIQASSIDYGITGMRLKPQGASDWEDFYEPDPGEFEIETPPQSTLEDLNAMIGGTHQIEVTHAGGTTYYNLQISPLDTSDFPDIPTLDTISPTIPQMFRFSWTWTGTADGKRIEYGPQSVDPIFGQTYNSGDSGFEDTYIDANFGAFVGPGEFMVGYGNASGAFVLTLSNGTDVFDDISSVTAAMATAEFEVIPEPAAAGLIGLSAVLWALLRRGRARRSLKN